MRCPQLEGHLHSEWWQEVRGKRAGHWWYMLQGPKWAIWGPPATEEACFCGPPWQAFNTLRPPCLPPPPPACNHLELCSASQPPLVNALIFWGVPSLDLSFPFSGMLVPKTSLMVTPQCFQLMHFTFTFYSGFLVAVREFVWNMLSCHCQKQKPASKQNTSSKAAKFGIFTSQVSIDEQLKHL